jgi:phosphoserine aminotransferase
MAITFAPGPSQLYPTVPAHIAEAIATGVLTASHRSKFYSELHAGTVAAIRELLGLPDDYHVWFVGSATEGLERIVQNTVQTHSHHFIAGAFAQRFADQAAGLGKTVTTTVADWGMGFDLDSEDIPDSAELITVTQNETSTGTSIDPESIARLAGRYPDKLLAVDITSSAPFVELDYLALDAAVFSVQKGFGLPAGLGVIIASPRALDRARQLQASGRPIGAFHSFPEMAAFEAKHQTSETPNVLGIYLLGAVCRDFLAYGVDRLRSELAGQADSIYKFLDEHPHYEPFVPAPHRSSTVIVTAASDGPRPVIDSLSPLGIKLGSGYGKLKDSHLRIANFPAHIGHTDRLIELLDKNASGA